MMRGPLTRRRGLFMALSALLATACHTSVAPSTAVVAAVSKVATYRRGQPAMVFVFTYG